MLRRLAAAGAVLAVLTAPRPATAVPQTAVIVDGVGAGHGLGLAMDGVLGEARAGWTYRKILSLFYPGTKPGRVRGAIRVGLAQEAAQSLHLPSGGEVTDGSPPGPGFPVQLGPGAGVTVSFSGGVYTVQLSGGVVAAQATIEPLPTPDSSPLPTPGPTPTPTPAPTPSPTPTPPPTPPPAATRTSSRPIVVTPSGSPALVLVDATGYRYRGTVEVRAGTRGLWAINHVDLETYVRGIAEEKGEGWPTGGLKVLAVAARTLGAATMGWYDVHHADGFDICPTGECQLYLGYDGEEPAMDRAAQATAGEVAEYGGAPILAMYHGNGGGRTESYKLLYGDGTSDPYPYLASVPYPFADPTPWHAEFTSGQVQAALAAKGVQVPGDLVAIDVVQRGSSPRVLSMRLHGTTGDAQASGLKFQSALGLRSDWFDVRMGGPPPVSPDPLASPAVPEALAASPVPTPSFVRAAVLPERAQPRRPDVLATAVLALALALGAAAGAVDVPRFRDAIRRSGGRGP